MRISLQPCYKYILSFPERPSGLASPASDHSLSPLCGLTDISDDTVDMFQIWPWLVNRI